MLAAFKPRPKQAEVLEYRGGKMGIAAVPGSGKTWTLSLLAVELLREGLLEDNQEILIVTLVNSAVENFSARIGDFVQQQGLLPNIGYRVRTLHGLAHDIVRGRPDLVGLAENFEIIDERAGTGILRDAVGAWLRSNPDLLDTYLLDDLFEDESKYGWVKREKLPAALENAAGSFIKTAKDTGLTAERLQAVLKEIGDMLPLARMGVEVYGMYQRALAYRGAVDFQDLIRLALEALRLDPTYLEYLQGVWPFILEDEAQDSSLLQERILRTLAGDNDNWVRVGDPNQAIYESFTTANPEFLRRYLEEEAGFPRELPNSGRSAQPIIDLANYLIQWSQNEHPVEQVRGALEPPLIEPTPPDDPQQNPPTDQARITFVSTPYTSAKEVAVVARAAADWSQEHPEETIAILVTRNKIGFELADTLRKLGHEPVDSLLRSTNTTRLAAGALTNLLHFLAEPTSPKKLATAYRVWRRGDREDEDQKKQMEEAAKLLAKISHVEDFVWPQPGKDWLERSGLEQDQPDLYEKLFGFRLLVQRWQGAVVLPVDQLVLSLAVDLFDNAVELAISHKLAGLLRQVMADNQDWRLPQAANELAVIAKNERRFLGLSEDDRGFDPDRYRGQVVLATVHQAKGLEWDRVHIVAANNYEYPSGLEGESYPGLSWFLRDELDLQAETLAQLESLVNTDQYEWYADDGRATQVAQIDYARERLRVLYVAITRAKKELAVSWNTGLREENQEAAAVTALRTYWEERNDDAAG